MNQETIVMLIIMLIGFSILGYIILSLKKNTAKDQSYLMLQNQLNSLNELVDKKMSGSTEQMQNQFDLLNKTVDTKLGTSAEMMQNQMFQSQKTIRQITEKLGELDNTNKQVVDFTEQLKGLQDILRNPKQRGVLGEYYLENVLQNVLPPQHFETQYKFSDGSIVDAVVFVKEKIIPIDSKFSLENYERMINANGEDERKQFTTAVKNDIKKRIDETAKYILPKENTLDFAFMFIPSEAIYYDILINKIGNDDLVEYAFKKKVMIASPTTFLAYLQTVMQGLRALQIEKSAEGIRKNVAKLSTHLGKFDEGYNKLGKNLSTVITTYNTGYNHFKQIDKDIVKITGQEDTIEPLALSKPEVE